MIILYSIPEEIGLGLFLGMYLLPILLIYGIPSSILSDFLTKKLSWLNRFFIALMIHLFMATLFVIVPTLLLEQERDMLFSDTSSLLNNFFFISAVLSAFLFWFIDELIRSELGQKIGWKFKEILRRFGNLRI